jgi:hypothetical protein
MKRSQFLFSAWIALITLSPVLVKAQLINPVTDTVIMGAGYANEVYYSLADGTKGSVNRKQWDIAFRASRMSASILTNDAANNNTIGLNGVELYTYSNADTSGWNSIDTAGFSTWKNLVNSTTDWETGAFCQNQLGHPDYGWGKYNSATHDVVGDSLYIIKLRDGSLKKLWIVRKYSSLNQVEFRFANIDNSGETNVLLDCTPYETKNFVGYSLTTNAIVDFEPAPSSDWDILFTKYMYTYPDGVLYPVTGVLNNYNIKVNTFNQVPTDFRMFEPETMDSTRSSIGWEWKYLDGSFIYHVYDSLVYFVQDLEGNIHRLVFKEFAGSSSGRIVLQKELLSLAGIGDVEIAPVNMAVYPNPANIQTSVILNPGNIQIIDISLADLSGQVVYKEQLQVQKRELNTITLPLSGITSGIYLLRIQAGNQNMVKKIVIQH